MQQPPAGSAAAGGAGEPARAPAATAAAAAGDAVDGDADAAPSSSPSVSEDEAGGQHATGDAPQPPRAAGPRPPGQVWSAGELDAALRALPGSSEAAAALAAAGAAAGAAARAEALAPVAAAGSGAGRAAVLMAARRGDAGALRALLRAGAPPLAADAQGRTALHLACCAGAESCVALLLGAGAPPQPWDAARRATPLHCAASAAALGCVRRLLRAGADANAGLAAGRAPLHYAVQSDAPDCAEALLRAGASPNTPQVFTETPLHTAAAMGFAGCLRLLLEHGADVRVQFGARKTTALHLAAEDGNAECARLLLDAGADAAARNHRLQTPLHLAALAQAVGTLELLLRRGADPDARDADARTPLHCAIVKVSSSSECVRALLAAGADANRADAFGYTPLHLAALNEFSSCVALLLRHGADPTARTNGGVSALAFIVRRTPDVLPRFRAELDAAVRLHEHELGDADCELQLDFRVLVPNAEKGESGLLVALIEEGQRHILQHPLCQAFLFLKWRRIRKFFLLSLLVHAVFVFVYSAYVIGIFYSHCGSVVRVSPSPGPSAAPSPGPTAAADDEQPDCRVPSPLHAARYLLLVLAVALLAKEGFQMAHDAQRYFHRWENWLQLQVIACALLSAPTAVLRHWQHHVAAVGIFLTWLELLLLVGRFPVFGLYVQMFATVALNFARFLLAYSCLLIAFSLSFGVLFPDYKAFRSVLWSLMKTVVMMSGELEFEDIFYGETRVAYPGTAHFVFLAFVLLVTVVLTNLLLGLAVSDIQGLQRSAGLDRLVRQAQLVAHLESLLFSRLLRCLPAPLLALCHRSALLLTSPYQWLLHVRPNDPRERRAPRELVDAAYRLVASRSRRRACRRAAAAAAAARAPLAESQRSPYGDTQPPPPQDEYYYYCVGGGSGGGGGGWADERAGADLAQLQAQMQQLEAAVLRLADAVARK